ncbi:hypothetical protein [Paenibacillus sp. An7]|uniref:hypothetical protein n=1 Tax=Paenibacillus sp. An7 TaxID=2689577 RepID=UPI001356E6D1|nr:hypothetical protein [Paenibacillus sp. An7]
MKNKALFATLIIVFLLFMFGNSMTTIPGQSSGNGNPAILLLLPLSIFFIVLTFQWFKFFKDKMMSNKTVIILSLLIICHHAIGLYYQIMSFQSYRILLAEVYERQFGTIDWDYINSITSGLSIHINNQYFNINTYFLFLSLSLLIWLLSQMIISLRRKMGENSGNKI